METQEMWQLTSTRIILFYVIYSKYRSSDENKCLTETLILVIGMELPKQPINFVLFSMPTLSCYHTILKKTENNVYPN